MKDALRLDQLEKIKINGPKYSRMDQVKFFKDCFPQILFDPFGPLSQMSMKSSNTAKYT